MGRRGKSSTKSSLRAANIKDVEAGLSQVRDDMITLGVPVKEQSNEQLFFVDQSGVKDEGERKKLKERGLLLKRPLKIDEILRPQSKIPAILGPKRATLGEKKLLERKIKSLSTNAPLPKATPKPSEYDIWADVAPAKKVRKPETSSRAVKVPCGGASYRPSSEKHEKLMEQAAKVEILKMEEQEQIEKKVPLTLLTGKPWSAVDLAVHEVLTGSLDVADNAEDTPEEPTDETPKKASARTNKKTKTERNREKKRKIEADMLRQAANEKKAKEELKRLKSISKTVQKELATKQAAMGERLAVKKSKNAQILKRLGKVTFTPAPIAVQIPEELGDSLRRMKTEGNLVVDRFKSLQERALIEPLSGTKKRQRTSKVKLVDPYSFRDFK